MKYNGVKARIINFDELPKRNLQTSTDIKIKNHTLCGGRCYIFYDEARLYRVECENCGTVVLFFDGSHDKAIEKWNSITTL